MFNQKRVSIEKSSLKERGLINKTRNQVILLCSSWTFKWEDWTSVCGNRLRRNTTRGERL